jgi:type IV secretory pathway VirD2 relaxase
MAMSSRGDEDRFEGKFGARPGDVATVQKSLPEISINARPKHERASWFNRARGQGRVKLQAERAVGNQRVIVKVTAALHARTGAGGTRALMRHALYVERDGAGRDGDLVQVFDRDLDRPDASAFADRCEADRRHLRVIISPEFGEEFADLKSYARDLMQRFEHDLGTRIDWIAAEHHDTGRPHLHILIRGKCENGRDLFIPRHYVLHSFRQHAEALATEELGPRLERDRRTEQSLGRAIALKRITHLDRILIERTRDQELRAENLPTGAGERAALVRRLNRLGDLGLAERYGPGRWRLDPDLGVKLIRMGEARGRERATAALLARAEGGLQEDQVRDLEIAHSSQRVWGRLVGFEPLSSNLKGAYLIGVEGADGRFWTGRVAREEHLRILNGVERGAIIELSRDQPRLRPSDQTILKIAGEDRLYSADLHRVRVPSDRDKYIEMHIRRLGALQREGIVERNADGAFRIPADYEARVLQREARTGSENARIELIDRHAIGTQETYRGPTLLDRIGDGSFDLSQLRRDGFGQELLRSWEHRKSTLRDLDLGRDSDGGFAFKPSSERALQELEREGLCAGVERETGRVAHFACDGDVVHGLFVSRIHAAQRSFALIVHGDTATFAPWRPEMDRALNQIVSGRVQGNNFDFLFGRDIERSVSERLGVGG